MSTSFADARALEIDRENRIRGGRGRFAIFQMAEFALLLSTWLTSASYLAVPDLPGSKFDP